MDVLRPKENFAIPSFACAEAPKIVSSGFGSIALFAGMLTPPKPVPRCAAFAASVPNGVPVPADGLTREGVARLIAVFIHVGVVEHELRGAFLWNYQLWTDKQPI